MVDDVSVKVSWIFSLVQILGMGGCAGADGTWSLAGRWGSSATLPSTSLSAVSFLA
jgi:hypothetical protein